MAAIICEQVVAEREPRNQRAVREHMRVIDKVIDKALADRSKAAARLREAAESKLDEMFKSGDTIEPVKTRARLDNPAFPSDGAVPRANTPKRLPSDRNR